MTVSGAIGCSKTCTIVSALHEPIKRVKRRCLQIAASWLRIAGMFTSYYDARDWLESFIPFVYGKEELGLARIQELLRLLENPEKKFRSIHIAGTSGKGSTVFYTAKLLQEAGFKVGLHISPHLIDIGERMQINGRPISPQCLTRLINQIRPIVESMKDSKVGLPSYFEILVAATFVYFAEEKVDFAVVEVGLGGRLDATNVLMPEVSVITNIGLDHIEILGHTIEKIAAEKAGIIKPGVPVVTGASGKALGVIEKVARKSGSRLVKVSTQKGPEGNFLLAKTVAGLLSLRGVERRSNLKRDRFALLAMTARGLPGRFEEIEPGVILDGAHNPDKVQSLINFIGNSKLQTPNSKITLVLAFKKGKKWKRMVDLLIKNLPVKQIIATEFNAFTDTGKWSTVPAEEIAEYVLSSKYYVSSIKIIKNSQEAVFGALHTTNYILPTTDLVLITGSLYLIGEVRTMWRTPEV